MYQNIDNMICDADSCEAAICECKRMRKADITAAIIWAAVAVSAFLLILLDAILDINIGYKYRRCSGLYSSVYAHCFSGYLQHYIHDKTWNVWYFFRSYKNNF